MIDFIRLKGDDGLTKDAENHLLAEYSTFDWIIEGVFQRNCFKMISNDKKSSPYSDYIFRNRMNNNGFVYTRACSPGWCILRFQRLGTAGHEKIRISYT
jgi:hypothetical protein